MAILHTSPGFVIGVLGTPIFQGIVAWVVFLLAVAWGFKRLCDRVVG